MEEIFLTQPKKLQNVCIECGTMKYKYNKSTKKIKIGKVTSTGINNSWYDYEGMVRFSKRFEESKIYVDDSILHIKINGVDNTFSPDSKYKYDH